MVDTETLIRDGLVDVMQTTPFRKIRIVRFVEHIGIGRSTFYNHFDRLEDVLEDLEDTFMAGLHDKLVRSVDFAEALGDEDQFESLVRMQVEYVRNNLKLCRALCGPNGDPAFQERMADRTRGLIRDVFKVPAGTPGIRWQILSEYAAGGQWYVYRWCAFQNDDIDPAVIAPYFAEIFRRMFDQSRILSPEVTR